MELIKERYAFVDSCLLIFPEGASKLSDVESSILS